MRPHLDMNQYHKSTLRENVSYFLELSSVKCASYLWSAAHTRSPGCHRAASLGPINRLAYSFIFEFTIPIMCLQFDREFKSVRVRVLVKLRNHFYTSCNLVLHVFSWNQTLIWPGHRYLVIYLHYLQSLFIPYRAYKSVTQWGTGTKLGLFTHFPGGHFWQYLLAEGIDNIAYNCISISSASCCHFKCLPWKCI